MIMIMIFNDNRMLIVLSSGINRSIFKIIIWIDFRIDVDRPNILLAIRKPRLESLFPLPVTKDRKSRGEIYVSGWTIVRLRHGFVQLMR